MSLVNEFVLTIGIPTYNGGLFLNQTIESIINQEEFKSGKVEILISDNASTDNTRAIVNNFIEQYPTLISYHNNKQNIGYDRNVDMLFKLSRAKFIHILGDDDYLVPGILKKICKTCLMTEGLAVILLNSSFLNINKGNEFGFQALETDMKFETGDDFFLYTKWRSAAVSSLVIAKDEWNKINVAPYFGNQWVHVSMLVEILSLPKKSYLISDKAVVIRRGNARWNNQNGNQLKLGLIHLKVLHNMISLGYDMKTYNYFYQSRYNTNLKDILNLAPKSTKNKLEVAKLMTPFFSKHINYWLLHLPSMFILAYPFQLVKHLAKKVIYKR